MAVEIRRATAQDAQRYYGGAPLMSFRGFVAVEDGENVVGIGGVYRDDFGRPIVFSQMKPQMRKYLKARAKAARMLVQFAHDVAGSRVYAVADPSEPTAPRLLNKLGFHPTGEMTAMGELLVKEK